jgi:hypothetical protein
MTANTVRIQCERVSCFVKSATYYLAGSNSSGISESKSTRWALQKDLKWRLHNRLGTMSLNDSGSLIEAEGQAPRAGHFQLPAHWEEIQPVA